MSSIALAGMTRLPSRSFRRAAKSGRFLAGGREGGGGGVIIATTFPRLLISTGSPSSTQLSTVPKSCRSWRTVALFMCNKNVTQCRVCQISIEAASPQGERGRELSRQDLVHHPSVHVGQPEVPSAIA